MKPKAPAGVEGMAQEGAGRHSLPQPLPAPSALPCTHPAPLGHHNAGQPSLFEPLSEGMHQFHLVPRAWVSCVIKLGDGKGQNLGSAGAQLHNLLCTHCCSSCYLWLHSQPRMIWLFPHPNFSLGVSHTYPRKLLVAYFLCPCERCVQPHKSPLVHHSWRQLSESHQQGLPGVEHMLGLVWHSSQRAKQERANTLLCCRALPRGLQRQM